MGNRKIIINESSLRKLVESTLLEISSQDAYNRFYSDLIPEKFYNALMAGTDKMTPYHKAILNSFVDWIKNKKQDNISEIGNLSQKLSKVWSDANQDVKQALINKFSQYKANEVYEPQRLCRIIEGVVSKKWHTERMMEDAGLKIIYEDDNVRVTCTTTYAASTRNYGKTHWCTASGLDGRYAGNRMFLNYTEDGEILVQFVDKNDFEHNTYQANFSEDGELLDIKDFYDEDSSIEDVDNKLFKKYGLNAHQILGMINYGELSDETSSNSGEEQEYWYDKTCQIGRRKFLEGMQCLKSGKMNDFLNRIALLTVNEKLGDYFSSEDRGNVFGGVCLNPTYNPIFSRDRKLLYLSFDMDPLGIDDDTLNNFREGYEDHRDEICTSISVCFSVDWGTESGRRGLRTKPAGTSIVWMKTGRECHVCQNCLVLYKTSSDNNSAEVYNKNTGEFVAAPAGYIFVKPATSNREDHDFMMCCASTASPSSFKADYIIDCVFVDVYGQGKFNYDKDTRMLEIGEGNKFQIIRSTFYSSSSDLISCDYVPRTYFSR